MRSFCLLALLFAVACGGSESDRSVFIWGKSGDAVKLDPANVTDGESVMVLTNIFDTLVTFEEGSIEIIPWLAESWEHNEARTVWTFKLRQGVTFHDGTPVNADAVVFSFMRQKDPAHPARRPDDAFAYYNDNFDALDKIEAVDEHTVRFTLSRTFAPFLSTLAMFCTAIVAPSGFEDGNDFATNPIGSGPFRFLEWKKDEFIKLEAFEDHFAGRPGVDLLIFKPIKQPEVRLKELESGGIQGMDNPSLVDVKRLEGSTDVQLLSAPGINVCYLALNTQKAPFDNKLVRQAAAWCIDKKRLIEAAYAGYGEPAVSMCPKTMKGHLAMKDREPDPEKARQLLAEGGYPQGVEIELWYPVIQRAYLPDSGATAIQLQQALEKGGFKVKLRKVEWTAYLEGTGNGAHQACIIGWMADIGDPDNYLYVLLDKENAVPPGANNRSFYTSEAYHQLVSKARSVPVWEEREKIYHEAQRLLFEDMPCVPLVTVPDFRVLAKGVTGYTIYPAGGEYFRAVQVNK
ncbi:MAG: ABC transporter substrate-binding protein [Planctomycetota bacterium]